MKTSKKQDILQGETLLTFVRKNGFGSVYEYMKWMDKYKKQQKPNDRATANTK